MLAPMSDSTGRGRRRPEGVQIATLTRLWNAAKSLSRVIAAGAAETAGSTPGGPPLWGTYALRLLDVRHASAFALRHIPESGSIPSVELEGRVFELPPRWRPMVVVSDDPRVAAEVTETLRGRGYLGSVPLIESIDRWPGPWESGPPRRTLWEPTPVVRSWAPRLRMGRVLDLGCGSGRDAVYLATFGHQVTAVDLLPDALAMAEQLAMRAGVSLRTRQMDLRKQSFPEGERFDTILMIRYLSRERFAWMQSALNPGGTLILEAFTRETADAEGVSTARTLAPQEALRAFTSGAHPFTVLEYREYPDPSGKLVSRLVARKE